MPPLSRWDEWHEHHRWMDEHSYPDPSPEERLYLADMAPGADEAVPGIARCRRPDEEREAA